MKENKMKLTKNQKKYLAQIQIATENIQNIYDGDLIDAINEVQDAVEKITLKTLPKDLQKLIIRVSKSVNTLENSVFAVDNDAQDILYDFSDNE